MSVSDRLGRLLFIVPYVASRDGVPVAELAEKLGVKPANIEADIGLLSMVGQPPLTPDHLIDLYIEDDVVYVDLHQNLSRPLRLTHEEARALVLGAKMVGDLGGLGERLEEVLEKIIDRLNPVDREMVRSLSGRIGMWHDAANDDSISHHVAQAIDEKRELSIEYFSVSSDREKTYRLKPLALINHSGSEYLVALDRDADDQEKLFRLDRVGAVKLLDATFDASASVDLEKFRTSKLYFGEGGIQAEVTFDSVAAPWVRERFPANDVVDHGDGSVTVRVATSSAAWLARWVLSFGTHAEVRAPLQVREFIAQLCEKAADSYASAVA